MEFNLITKFDKRLQLSKLQRFHTSKLNNDFNKLFVKRDDLIHNQVSGNKWRKLKWNVIRALENNCNIISTYGGAYSNHLLATAALGKDMNLQTRAFVRGDELNYSSNHILQRCHDLNMELVFLSRNDFKELKYSSGIDPLNHSVWNVPEGGANREGVMGCQEIMAETDNNYDYVVIAQGTTTTSLGVLTSLNPKTKLIVVPVLKGFDSIGEMKKLAKKINLTADLSRVLVLDQYHFGGYSKTNNILDQFVIDFNKSSDFKIEQTYTGKALFAMIEYIKNNSLNENKLLFIHTGGIV